MPVDATLRRSVQEDAIRRMQDGEDPEDALAAMEESLGAAIDETTNTGDKITLYSIVDGETSHCYRYMLPTVYNFRLPDGRRAYSLKPTNPAWQYEDDSVTGLPRKVHTDRLVCPLNPKHSEFHTLAAKGLVGKVCNPTTGRHKENIPNDYEVEMHMRRKHKAELAVLERWEERRRRDEELSVQKMQMEAMQKLAGRQTDNMPQLFFCRENCGRFFDSEMGEKIHNSKDHKVSPLEGN